MPGSIRRADPATLSARHLAQLVELVLTTGYYQYAALGNPQGLTYQAQTLAGFVRPCLPHTWLLLDETANLAGCYVALDRAADEAVDYGDNWPDDTPAMAELGEALAAFSAAQDDDAWLVQAFAIRFDRQGVPFPGETRSHAQVLFDHLGAQALGRGKRRLALTVWASHAAAWRFYTRQGGTVVREHDFRQTLLHDRLLEMHIPLA